MIPDNDLLRPVFEAIVACGICDFFALIEALAPYLCGSDNGSQAKAGQIPYGFSRASYDALADMISLKRLLAVCLLAAGAVSARIFAFAPQVPILLREGFPSEVWNDGGRYDHVDGVNSVGTTGVPAIPAAAQTLFDAAGGRAILVDKGGSLIFESYGYDFGTEKRLNSFSLVKSLVGALVIRALADNRIA
ncbi:hypothetical protein KIN_02180 [Litoreibacter roseus]|uniref:Beta-lactamase n=2 Tax=Litoreibacter roseus TaxID=2601869 RepID=A0A6N6JAS7_9RHOB|nr:hypothetical protein KIN_02180 [Litoreibacter roseus]